jgi:hypothetical protein
VHQYLGFALTWDTDYHYKLILRGCQRFIGLAPNRKSAFSPHMLYDINLLLDLRLPLHSALWALCLVAFFTFLRKSNLVVEHADRISPNVTLCQDLSLHTRPHWLSVLLRQFNLNSGIFPFLCLTFETLRFAPSQHYKSFSGESAKRGERC